MSWLELQLEHLAGALIVCWLAFGWFCWGCGQKVALPGTGQDPTWNWLAGAALLGSGELFAWLILIQSRFESWPVWAHTLLGTFVALRGASAAVAAAGWFGRPFSRGAGWGVLLVFGLLVIAFPKLAALLGSAGWIVAALAFVGTEASGLPRWSRLLLGCVFAGLAVSDAVTPDLTQLILRLPSEQPLQWGSRDLVALTTKSGLLLVAALALGVVHQPRRWRAVAVLAAGAAVVLTFGWRDMRAHAALRARIWAELEETARMIGPSFPVLNLAPGDIHTS